MKRKLSVMAIVAFCLVITNNCAWAKPALINVVMDATGSISGDDFKRANKAAFDLALALYERSKKRPNMLSDWVALSYFGGNNDYQGSKFVQCSDPKGIAAIGVMTTEYAQKHPQFGNTAIYSALLVAAGELIVKERELGEPSGTFLKVILLVTDGDDNDSSNEDKKTVIAKFPNDEFMVMIIGVGKNSQVEKFRTEVDHVSKIQDFNRLAAAMLVSLDLIDNK